MAKLSAYGRTEIETWVSKDGQRKYRGMSDGTILTQYRTFEGKWSRPTIAKRCSTDAEVRESFARLRARNGPGTHTSQA